MWHLAKDGRTIVWDVRDAPSPIVLYADGQVEAEPSAHALHDLFTWYLVHRKVPNKVAAKTVMVSCQDRKIWKNPAKRGGSVI